MMNDHEEEKQRKAGRIYGWTIPRRVDRSKYSMKWDHNEDSYWLDLTVHEKQKNEVQC